MCNSLTVKISPLLSESPPAEPAAVLESRTRVTGLSAGLYSGESSSYTRNAGAECSGGETVADILVIDDDDDLRDTLRAMLEGAGHTVFDARNGLEGVAFYQMHSIGFCRKVRFLGKIQKSGIRNSTTYRLPIS